MTRDVWIQTRLPRHLPNTTVVLLTFAVNKPMDIRSALTMLFVASFLLSLGGGGKAQVWFSNALIDRERNILCLNGLKLRAEQDGSSRHLTWLQKTASLMRQRRRHQSGAGGSGSRFQVPGSRFVLLQVRHRVDTCLCWLSVIMTNFCCYSSFSPPPATNTTTLLSLSLSLLLLLLILVLFLLSPPPPPTTNTATLPSLSPSFYY